MEKFKNDKHHIEAYYSFAQKWGTNEVENLVKYYDIYELTAFLPSDPSENEKLIFSQLIGTTTPSGYLDYQRSNNTFELIMQWREKTGNLGNDTNFLNR